MRSSRRSLPVPVLPLMLVMLVAALGSLGGCATAPARGGDAGKDGYADGRDLVGAMNARYAGAWYPACTIEQRVTHYQGGAPVGNEVWTEILALPGRVRSTIGDPEDGNFEVYVDGTSHVFDGGVLTHSGDHPHAVLLLGFDVYVQDPPATIAKLEAAEFDLGLIRRGTWKERPAWIVGADDGDLDRNQFWVDAEHMLVQRVFTRSPSGRMIEVEFGDYRRLGGGWIAASLVFKADGEILLEEEYLDFGLLEAVDPGVFDVAGLMRERGARVDPAPERPPGAVVRRAERMPLPGRSFRCLP